MKIRLKRKYDIGGQVVRVSYYKDLKGEYGERLLGQCDTNNNIIKLQMGLPHSKKIAVFVHEYIHFVSAVYGLNLSESRVNILEVAFLRLMGSLHKGGK